MIHLHIKAQQQPNLVQNLREELLQSHLQRRSRVVDVDRQRGVLAERKAERAIVCTTVDQLDLVSCVMVVIELKLVAMVGA